MGGGGGERHCPAGALGRSSRRRLRGTLERQRVVAGAKICGAMQLCKKLKDKAMGPMPEGSPRSEIKLSG